MNPTAQQVRWSLEDPLLAAVPLVLAWLVWSGAVNSDLGVALFVILVIAAAVIIGIEQQLAYRRDGESPVGSRQLPRVALVAAVTVFEPAGDPVAGAGRALAMLIIVAGLIVEPAIARGAASKLVFVHGLPGIPPLPEPRRWLPPAVLWASLGATVAGACFGWLAGIGVEIPGSWLWAVAAVLAALVTVAFLAETAGRIRRHREIERQLSGAVAAYGPRFVVYTARPDDASYQVAMWLPYLKRAGLPFLIVARDELPARVLAGLTDVPIVVRRTIGGLDDVIAPTLRAAFYVNASSGNGVFIRYGHLTHVYLGHGDSDKPPSYNPTHAMYDRIFAAGPAATRRYADHGVRIPADKFRVVGRPQVEGVQVVETGGGTGDGPVLYAPTWRGHVTETQLSSLPVGLRIVEALLARGRTVIFRPHPFSYHFAEDTALVEQIQRRLADDAAATGRAHVWGPAAESDRTVLDCTNESAAMIADVSAIVSDYLYSRKPFAMVAVPQDDPVRGDFVAQYPIARGAYVLDRDLANLEPVLDDLLGADPHAAVRAEIRADYLGDFPAEHYADAFVDAVRDAATETDPGNLHGLSEPDEPSRPSRRANLRRQLSALAGGAMAGALSALALAAVLIGAPEPVPVVLALAGVLLIGWLRRTQLVDLRDWESLLTFAGPARLLLAVGLGLNAAAGPVELATTVVVVLCVAAETAIKRGWGRHGVEVANLPSLRAELRQPALLRLTWPGSLAVIAAGWLGWVLPALGWLALGLAVLLLAVTAGALALAAARVHQVVAAEERLPQVVRELAPRFAAYFASPVGARYQLGMWLPYFDRIGEPYMIITRDLRMHREIAAMTSVPVIYRPSLGSLEEVIVPSLTTCFYVNNAVKNTHFIERRELTHVWLNHGDSEKPACYNPVHAIYDLIFAAGQAGIDRYARHGVDIPAEKFRIVGRPQVELIKRADLPVQVQQRPTVLYAPTWQGSFADTKVYSLPVGERIVQALLARGVRVIFRAHPFNYRFPAAVELIKKIQARLAADPAGGHVWGDAAEQAMSVEDCFNASDAMISDVSAVVSDYLHSAKPFAIVSVGRTPEDLVRDAPAALAGYLIEDDLGNLATALDDLLINDPKLDERASTRIYYLGDFPAETYADGFLDAARAVISRGPADEAVDGLAFRQAQRTFPPPRPEPAEPPRPEPAEPPRPEPVEGPGPVPRPADHG
ncbi:CDP-glycerol glycerophosphotransferase family protein [Microlunatus parietis]|uniref:CDP-glycerol glycerophosphotransferase (TagB/SpsB family) n=1 Tax=Microlunatus parietis TaxID=682979 RepID=A0A7Y9IG45_9ACTN|nr:CDP-glycerol glycerophosphotransferase family protein [Microlunatus parietis]NYE75604.1 CDP-glycerol glycerophosphotransferase (TagB/SpsB family) [Microlunatus parietis]